MGDPVKGPFPRSGVGHEWANGSVDRPTALVGGGTWGTHLTLKSVERIAETLEVDPLILLRSPRRKNRT